MEYDSPIFIAAVKKILREGVTHLADSIENLKNAVSAHWQADEERYQTKPVAVSDLRADVPIPVEDKTKKSVPEWIWTIFKGALEIIGILAVITYTFVAYQANQLSMANYRRVRIDANEQLKESAEQTKLAGETLAATAKNFRVDQRAWVTLYPQILTKAPMGTPANTIPIIVAWNNTGHTPALDSELAFGYLYSTKDYVSDVSSSTAHTTVLNPSEKITRAVYAPNGSGVSPPYYVPVAPPGKFLFVSGTVTYKDVFGDHHQTTFCMKEITVGQLPNFVFCNAHNSED